MPDSDEIDWANTMLPGIPLAARPENPKKPLARKEGWPIWPFWWMDDRSMDALREIASRLKDKVDGAYRGCGVTGETTPVEKQIIDILSSQQQQFTRASRCVPSFFADN